MKKLFSTILVTTTIVSINAEQPKIIEWDAKQYAQGNKTQYQAALNLLEKNNIETEDKDILDVGCGTGEISEFLAQTAKSVDGFDASHNMIEWAQEHHTSQNNNISFTQSCAENWSSTKKYDLATMFFCFHWFADKQKALNQTAESLKKDGELFGTFSTSDMPQPPGLAIVKKMMEDWKVQTNFSESLGRSTVDTETLKALLTNAGFDIIKCELQVHDAIFPERADLENFTRPVLMSRPFIQKMLPEKRERFLTEYIDTIIPILQDNNTNQLKLKMFMTIVHARKR